jgi:hypothetical protein
MTDAVRDRQLTIPIVKGMDLKEAGEADAYGERFTGREDLADTTAGCITSQMGQIPLER